MTVPAATRKDHLQFCRRERWREVRRASGAEVAHHITLELELDDGRVLRTRISRPPNRVTYGKALWAHILRDQLEVTSEQFWACVRDDVLPIRSRPSVEPATGTPLEVISLLVTRVGLSDDEARALSRDEAIERLNRFWTEGADES